MWFKLAFVVAFLFATTIAARTARLASRRHGGSLNQLSHEVPGLLGLRAALGLVFYATLFTWFFLPDALLWTYWPATAPRACAVGELGARTFWASPSREYRGGQNSNRGEATGRSARFEAAVYALHAFQKKTQQTAKVDIELARVR